ncbi:MAG: UvrD-helicase domain-containing protein [Oscillospiraceae bacterium]|nr:UvrD-helicase domain-containing protein [Oscillospiraceae bacterium]
MIQQANWQKEKEIYFHKLYHRLNQSQKAAVFAVNGPVLILAGAGSGKTTVLVERISQLLNYGDAYEWQNVPAAADDLFPLLQRSNAGEKLSENESEILRLSLAHQPVKPYKILAITFTNKAARELKERIIAKTGSRGEGIWACTFHSACLRMLRSGITHLGYPSNFTIYDTDDQVRVIKKLMADREIDEKIFPAKKLLGRIGRLKDRLIGPEEYAAKHENTYEAHLVANLYPLYQEHLKRSGAVDFDDIICLTVRLFDSHPEILERYQRQFSHIMVDEYQDTNPAQFELVRLLSMGSKNLCVVGDDDQSIYRFRGATIENILSFEEQFPSCRTVRLEEKYRSTPAVLEAANRVIANNKNRKGKTLRATREDGDPVRLVRVSNDLSEGNYIAKTIKDNLLKGAKYADHAVLYRVNAQSNSVERALSAARIPYRVFGGQPFLGRKEIKDVRAYLCLILNPHDDERVIRVINEPKRAIGNTTVAKVRELADQYDCSLFTILERADTFSCFSGKTATSLLNFASLIRNLQSLEKELSLDLLYDRMLEMTGYEMSLMAQGEEGLTRLENVKEFRSNIADFLLRESKTPDLYVEFEEEETERTLLEKFLAETELSTDQDRSDDSDDCVTLMTIHSAKGLEFPVVFLPGMEENLFPSVRSLETEEDLEEERRLAYVAVTRAKNQLYLFWAEQRLLYGRTMLNPVSRYVEEMGDDLLEKEFPDRRTSASSAGKSFAGSSYGNAFGGGSFGGGQRPQRSASAPIRGLSGGAGGSIPGLKKPVGGAVPGRVSATSKPSGGGNAAIRYEKGMAVVHEKFGDGVVISVAPMGNDQLIEVEFDRAGKKKLMGRLANMKLRED